MKRFHTKSFFSGVLVTLLAVGLIGTAAATVGKQMIEVDYKNIQVSLNGKILTLSDAKGNTVEPFGYNGTTYLPVRAIADALGASVEYIDSKYSDYATIILTPDTTPALNSNYGDSGVPRLESIVGNNAYYDSIISKVSKVGYMYSISYFKDGTADSYQSLYQKLLESRGFKLDKALVVDGSTDYQYKNSDTGVLVSVYESDSTYVFITVNTEKMKTSTTSGGSSSSSSGSSSGTTTTPADPPPAPSPSEEPSSKFDGMCPYCNIACSRDYINETYEIWKCRNPQCNHYNQVVYP